MRFLQAFDTRASEAAEDLLLNGSWKFKVYAVTVKPNREANGYTQNNFIPYKYEFFISSNSRFGIFAIIGKRWVTTSKEGENQ